MTQPAQPVIARTTPYAVQVEKDQVYFWCACGRSDSQPFCDGSHKDTGITPVRFTATRSEWLWFCGCKQTGSQPFCDGSHKNLGG